MDAAKTIETYADAGRTSDIAAGWAPLYTAEALCSVAGTLLSIGVSFYMKDRFHWQMWQIFLINASQGVVYVPGALLARWVTARVGRRRALCGIYAILTVLSLAAARIVSAPGIVTILLAYTFVIGISWPMLESLVAGGRPQGMARRLAIYNVVWPAAGAAAIAVEGTIIRYWTAGVFLIPAAMHILSLGLMLLLAAGYSQTSADAASTAPHIAPEPQLLRKRKLALWLSRTALPATYTVIYGLMPIMPFLPVMKPLGTATQTLVASVWLVTRWIAFVVLALGSWWHARPRVLLWAAVLMLVSFFGMTLRPTGGASPATDLASMIAWQAALGLALGMIYAASLYFGMVLSDGSTAHGGYHEALIGLGWLLGPAVGAAGQLLFPDNALSGIAAVGSVIALSVIVVLATAAIMNRPVAQTG